MNFNTHSNLVGRHAFLSPSNYHWINYDEDKLDRVFFMQLAAQRGVELHSLGHQLIRLGVKLPTTRKTLNMYVNDAIGYRMTPEQSLYYSDNCFGTADAIGFRANRLRIHDLKTGLTEASMHQLEVYAALFCLEYRFKPFEIAIELRSESAHVGKRLIRQNAHPRHEKALLDRSRYWTQDSLAKPGRRIRSAVSPGTQHRKWHPHAMQRDLRHQ
jgi:hypothetical protein